MKNRYLALFTAALMSFGLTACGPQGTEGEQDPCANLEPGKILQECIDKSTPKAERIDAENDPRNFGVNLATEIDQLPTQGRTEQMAWAGDYWATVNDSVNHRWQGRGTYSPLEKFDLAFNSWNPPAGFDSLQPFQGCGQSFDREYYDSLGPAAKYWSNNHGNKPRRDRWDDDDCSDTLENWFGLCHAWVPASILEPEPAKAVTYNGVTFEVSDMKALLLMAYNRSSTRFLGRRCNLRNDEIERDENGRIQQVECRDTNAGSLHLILANFLGRDRRAFAEDRTTNYQVWNQPVIGYRIDLLEEIDAEQATKLLDPDCSDCSYQWNEEAERFFEVLADVDYITESHASTEPTISRIDRYTRTDTYHYVLECDQAGNIIGGEWISARVTAFPDRISFPPDSQDNHSDFLWLPLSAGRATNPYASLEQIRMLVRMSLDDDPPPEGDAKVFKSTQAVEIPDNDRQGAVSAIEVDENVEIRALKVAVNISHTYIGDLTVSLRHGDKTVTLQSGAGGGTSDIHKTFTVDGFSGSAQGTWELLVVDGAAQDSGKIDSWDLIVIIGEGGGGGGSDAEVFSSANRTDIPDNDSGGAKSVINVPGSGPITSLKVTVDISHTWISDLRVVLKHGTGITTLHNREGNNGQDIQKTYSIDDFNGADSGGEWTLEVTDHARRDVGALNSWKLEIVR